MPIKFISLALGRNYGIFGPSFLLSQEESQAISSSFLLDKVYSIKRSYLMKGLFNSAFSFYNFFSLIVLDVDEFLMESCQSKAET